MAASPPKVAYITLAKDIGHGTKDPVFIALALEVMPMRGFAWALALILMLASGGWAEMITRGPILIHSEADLYGIAQGFGTVDSPFILEGFRIDAAGEPFGILVANFSRPLILRHLEVYGASVAAIRILNARYITIENVVVRGSAAGILVGGGKTITIRKTRVVECQNGVRLMFSEGITLAEIEVEKAEVGIWFQGTTRSTLRGSKIQKCGLGLLLELGSMGNLVAGNAFFGNHVHAYSTGGNAFDDGKIGNFWDGFESLDQNGDGILDEPYFIGPDKDRFPLASVP